MLMVVTLAMRSRQRVVYRELCVRVRRNRLGSLAYLVGYQAILSPVALFRAAH